MAKGEREWRRRDLRRREGKYLQTNFKIHISYIQETKPIRNTKTLRFQWAFDGANLEGNG